MSFLDSFLPSADNFGKLLGQVFSTQNIQAVAGIYAQTQQVKAAREQRRAQEQVVARAQAVENARAKAQIATYAKYPEIGFGTPSQFDLGGALQAYLAGARDPVYSTLPAPQTPAPAPAQGEDSTFILLGLGMGLLALMGDK